MKARILVQQTASKCNKELLKFMYSNIKVLKKYMDVKIVIVYKKMIPKLPKSITKLPVLVVPGRPVVSGNKAIKTALKEIVEGKPRVEGVRAKPKQVKDDLDLDSYLNSVMYAKDDEQTEDEMDAVKTMAMNRSAIHRSNLKKRRPRKKSSVDTPSDNIKLDSINSSKISDFAKDPVMKKYFESREESPTG